MSTAIAERPSSEPVRGASADMAQAALRVRVARTADEVESAWRLVYASYLQRGLLSPNRHEIHIVPQSLQQRSAVIVGTRSGQLTSTMSCYDEDGLGLPLDAVYSGELDGLRRAGRRLYEVGMLAERVQSAKRSATELFEVMRFAFHYGVWADCTDMIIGVHPRHSGFYCRLLGFEQAGPERSYDLVNDHPAVLLRLDLLTASHRTRVPRGLRYFLDHPVPPGDFDGRFRFREQSVYASLRERVESMTGRVRKLDAA